MNKHTIGNLEARFSFTDRDGHQISGSYTKEDLATLLEYLGDYFAMGYASCKCSFGSMWWDRGYFKTNYYNDYAPRV